MNEEMIDYIASDFETGANEDYKFDWRTLLKWPHAIPAHTHSTFMGEIPLIHGILDAETDRVTYTETTLK